MKNNKKLIAIVVAIVLALIGLIAVSYTHLDVYKRQANGRGR